MSSGNSPKNKRAEGKFENCNKVKMFCDRLDSLHKNRHLAVTVRYPGMCWGVFKRFNLKNYEELEDIKGNLIYFFKYFIAITNFSGAVIYTMYWALAYARVYFRNSKKEISNYV